MFRSRSDKISITEAINLDIIFLVDTSGSMSNELEAVKKSCSDFADVIIRENKKVRLGLIGFDIGGYRGDIATSNYKVRQLSSYTIGIWNLTNPSIFKENIKTLTLGLFGGGGCYLAEKSTVDIFPCVVSSFNDSRHAKILVIISDEMGNNDGLDEIVELLNSEKIETYVLGVPKMNGAHECIATMTGGKFRSIYENRGQQDFSVLLQNVASEIVGSIAQKAKDAGLTDEILAKYSADEPLFEKKTETLDSAGITAKWGKKTDNNKQSQNIKADDIGATWK